MSPTRRALEQAEKRLAELEFENKTLKAALHCLMLKATPTALEIQKIEEVLGKSIPQ